MGIKTLICGVVLFGAFVAISNVYMYDPDESASREQDVRLKQLQEEVGQCQALLQINPLYLDKKPFRTRFAISKEIAGLEQITIRDINKPWHAISFWPVKEMSFSAYIQKAHADHCLVQIKFDKEEGYVYIYFVEMPDRSDKK